MMTDRPRTMTTAVVQRPPRLVDPYLELEVYLSRVHKEIGDAFDLLVQDGVAANSATKLPTQKTGRKGHFNAVNDLGKSWTEMDISSRTHYMHDVTTECDREVSSPTFCQLSQDCVSQSSYDGDSERSLSSSCSHQVNLVSSPLSPPKPPQRSDSLLFADKQVHCILCRCDTREPRSASLPPNNRDQSDSLCDSHHPKGRWMTCAAGLGCSILPGNASNHQRIERSRNRRTSCPPAHFQTAAKYAANDCCRMCVDNHYVESSYTSYESQTWISPALTKDINICPCCHCCLHCQGSWKLSGFVDGPKYSYICHRKPMVVNGYLGRSNEDVNLRCSNSDDNIETITSCMDWVRSLDTTKSTDNRDVNLKATSISADVQSLSSFVDSLVQEMNNMSVNDELNFQEKQKLARFALSLSREDLTVDTSISSSIYDLEKSASMMMKSVLLEEVAEAEPDCHTILDVKDDDELLDDDVFEDEVFDSDVLVDSLTSDKDLLHKTRDAIYRDTGTFCYSSGINRRTSDSNTDVCSEVPTAECVGDLIQCNITSVNLWKDDFVKRTKAHHKLHDEISNNRCSSGRRLSLKDAGTQVSCSQTSDSEEKSPEVEQNGECEHAVLVVTSCVDCVDNNVCLDDRGFSRENDVQVMNGNSDKSCSSISDVTVQLKPPTNSQKPCDLGEFLRQVESSIRESTGSSSRSLVSDDDDDDAVHHDAVTQTSPVSSHSSSDAWNSAESDFSDDSSEDTARQRCSIVATISSEKPSVVDTQEEELSASVDTARRGIVQKDDGSSLSGFSLSESLDNLSPREVTSDDDGNDDGSVAVKNQDLCVHAVDAVPISKFHVNSISTPSDKDDKIASQCLLQSASGAIGNNASVKQSTLCSDSTITLHTKLLQSKTCRSLRGPVNSSCGAFADDPHQQTPSVLQIVSKSKGSKLTPLQILSVKVDTEVEDRTDCVDAAQDSCDTSSKDPWTGVPMLVDGVWLDMNKSSSAPVLGSRGHRIAGGKLGGACSPRNGLLSANNSPNLPSKTFKAPRSQSAKELTELEAVEACKWLRAAGFPQYAQMFEDMQFPIDVSAVQKDHYFLDQDSIQSLFRRLNALNRCARMRLDNHPRKISVDDSDDENQCALSENWEFQRQSRRWSRIPGNFDVAIVAQKCRDSDSGPIAEDGENSHCETVCADCKDTSSVQQAAPAITTITTSGGRSPVPMDEDVENSRQTECKSEKSELRRSGSERFKDGAKALLRRVESLKTRRSRRKNREAVVISGPQLLDVPGVDDVHNLAYVQITPPDTPLQTNPTTSPSGGSSSPSPNSPSDTSQHSTPPYTEQSAQKRGRRFFGGTGRRRGENDSLALSDSECSPTFWRSGPSSPTNTIRGSRCYIEQYLTPGSPHLMPDVGGDGSAEDENENGINYRTGSFNLGAESASYRERFQDGQNRAKRGNKRTASGMDQDRHSVYDNVPVVIFNKGYTDEHGEPLQEDAIFKNITRLNLAFSRTASVEQRSGENLSTTTELASSNEADSGSVASTNQDVSDQESRTLDDRRDSGVGLSLTRSERMQPRWQTSMQCHRPSIPCRCLPLNGLSSGQIVVLRKLALLKLTALMERYCPSNRSGWNWVMPKFIKRMKTPDYKDKAVFGVPLVVVLQRTGHPIPPSIQAAIRFIRKNAIDAVGIFRKSGVRSRIQKLKNLNEANPSGIAYEEQQPYDVADMIKQYFRELPEALLTNKMSETFISIYQHIEEDARLEALQASLILMPDENREVLQALLSFLNDVSLKSEENQMTASNLAVCFAPSLFHMSNPRSQSTSPRRRKTVGIPDQRELNENKAAHECLTHMIRDFQRIFCIPEDILIQCRCPYLDYGCMPTMDELLQKGGSYEWQTLVESSMQWMLKESRDKYKGWVTVATNDSSDISHKKVGDGNPLRMFKVSVEVEAPPIELLNRVLRERHLWDSDLLKWRVIERLDKQTEIFQYVTNSMTPLPPRDYCVLRSWRTDFPKGTCIFMEMSVDHSDALPLMNGVRANVLASRYLIEPCGSGKSRVTHVSRVDTRGRSPEWYNRVHGHLCSLFLAQLRDSLRHTADGPESKV